ncbi:hypothetical protein [Chitinimonas sp. BJB300]|nr:hypothetical protein [Chitinimonas sp. BJB300]
MKPRWADEGDDEEYRILLPAEPVPLWAKQLALCGIVLFWVYFLGWLGEGGQAGMESGFMVFVVCQFPLVWRWTRGQMGRWR